MLLANVVVISNSLLGQTMVWSVTADVRPTASLLFHVIKTQGGGFALSQKTVWKNDAEKEHDKKIESMGWEVAE